MDLAEVEFNPQPNWGIYQITAYISDLVIVHRFETWADWLKHAETACAFCHSLLEKLNSLNVQLPDGETPITEAIELIKQIYYT